MGEGDAGCVNRRSWGGARFFHRAPCKANLPAYYLTGVSALLHCALRLGLAKELRELRELCSLSTSLVNPET